MDLTSAVTDGMSRNRDYTKSKNRGQQIQLMRIKAQNKLKNRCILHGQQSVPSIRPIEAFQRIPALLANQANRQ